MTEICRRNNIDVQLSIAGKALMVLGKEVNINGRDWCPSCIRFESLDDQVLYSPSIKPFHALEHDNHDPSGPLHGAVLGKLLLFTFKSQVIKVTIFLDGVFHLCGMISNDYDWRPRGVAECYSYNATLDYWAPSGR